jgi:Lysozyme like domain
MANLSVLEIYRLARRAGFSADNDDAVTATAIALAESGGNPDAHNTNKKTGDNSFGLWQINMIGNSALRGGNSSASPATRSSSIPRRTRALPTVSSRHHPGGFGNWTTFKKGLHKQHLSAARQAAQQAGEPGFVDVEEVDVTEQELRKVVNEEITKVLNQQAVKVFGITSWENYLEALLKAARND